MSAVEIVDLAPSLSDEYSAVGHFNRSKSPLPQDPI